MQRQRCFPHRHRFQSHSSLPLPSSQTFQTTVKATGSTFISDLITAAANAFDLEPARVRLYHHGRSVPYDFRQAQAEELAAQALAAVAAKGAATTREVLGGKRAANAEHKQPDSVGAAAATATATAIASAGDRAEFVAPGPLFPLSGSLPSAAAACFAPLSAARFDVASLAYPAGFDRSRRQYGIDAGGEDASAKAEVESKEAVLAAEPKAAGDVAPASSSSSAASVAVAASPSPSPSDSALSSSSTAADAGSGLSAAGPSPSPSAATPRAPSASSSSSSSAAAASSSSSASGALAHAPPRYTAPVSDLTLAELGIRATCTMLCLRGSSSRIVFAQTPPSSGYQVTSHGTTLTVSGPLTQRFGRTRTPLPPTGRTVIDLVIERARTIVVGLVVPSLDTSQSLLVAHRGLWGVGNDGLIRCDGQTRRTQHGMLTSQLTLYLDADKGLLFLQRDRRQVELIGVNVAAPVHLAVDMADLGDTIRIAGIRML